MKIYGRVEWSLSLSDWMMSSVQGLNIENKSMTESVINSKWFKLLLESVDMEAGQRKNLESKLL